MLNFFPRFNPHAQRPPRPVDLLVVGCGNVTAGDDAAGAEIVSRLKAAGHQRCQFVAVHDAGPELLELFATAETVLFVDAVASSAPPGTLHLVPLRSGEIEPRLVGTLSSHGWGLAQTLELGRALHRHLPRLMLLGIELGSVRVGDAPSPPVGKAMARVVKKFSRLHDLLMDPQNPVWLEPRHFAADDTSFPKV